MSTNTGRRMREDGLQARAEILEAAARLASQEGLEGLSIGRLAEETGRSKSGVYAHFQSKEALQLATIDTAYAIYQREVMALASGQPSGLLRLVALCEASLSYTERRVFPGGCFFVTSMAEFRARSGRIRAKLGQIQQAWLAYVEDAVRAAVGAGDLPQDTDVAGLAFELYAILQTVDIVHVLSGDGPALAHARAAVERLLGRELGG